MREGWRGGESQLQLLCFALFGFCSMLPHCLLPLPLSTTVYVAECVCGKPCTAHVSSLRVSVTADWEQLIVNSEQSELKCPIANALNTRTALAPASLHRCNCTRTPSFSLSCLALFMDPSYIQFFNVLPTYSAHN